MRIQIVVAVLAAIMGMAGVVTPQDAYAAGNEYVEVTPQDAAGTITEEAAEKNTHDIPQLGIKAGEVSINEDSFPDVIFRSYVESEFDTDGDGVLSQPEINAVTGISVWSKGISSLKGVEYFVNLKNLDCLDNRLSQLDVSGNVNLTSLNCQQNSLSELDVSKNVNLTFLSCVSNSISGLDVSRNVNLETLNCADNNLSGLDVSKNVKLMQLYCSSNHLSQLDVSKNVKLTLLSCHSNGLSQLDVSRNVNLNKLLCDSNRLSQLDVRRNVNLTELNCSFNRLNRLDVSRNVNLKYFYCASNRLGQLDVSKNTKLWLLDSSNNGSNNIIINKGQSFRLNQVAESSSNTKSVVINKDGKVSAIRSGTAIVTVRDVKGVKSSYTVTVTEAGAYKITYKLNGGKNASGNPATYRSKAVKLKSPTRKGCIFKGWYQTAEFKGKITTIAPSLKKHLTVYAKWEKVKVGKSAVTGLKNLSGKKAKVSIKKVSGAKGYEVVYSTDKRFKKGKKTITVKKNTATLRKLKKNKRYYVKCRAYKLDSTGKKVYGKYSAVKNVRIRK